MYLPKIRERQALNRSASAAGRMPQPKAAMDSSSG
jgi:hypothetical protein